MDEIDITDVPETEDDKIKALQEQNDGLHNSLEKLYAFQKQMASINGSLNVEEILDQVEMMLDDTVEFIYVNIFLQQSNKEMKSIRQMVPEEIELDWSLVTWAISNQELSLIPLEETEDEMFHSLVILPLVGSEEPIGVIVLWITESVEEFTNEQSMQLNMLGKEAAFAIENNLFKEKMDQARARISDVVETVPHGLMSLNIDGEIDIINSTMEFMLDLRRGDVVGKVYSAGLPASVAERLAEILKDSFSDEAEVSIDFGGRVEVFGLSATPIYEPDTRQVAGHVIICRDLKLTREVERLREVDSMKNDFLSLVSHELRTPLTSIMAYSETLLMEGMIDTEEERREYLQIIYDEGSRLSRLINDVLDLTKMEAGKLDYFYEDIDINELIIGAQKRSVSLITQKNQTMCIELTENIPLIKADGDRLIQVLTNFISNAVKFTPEGGTVTLRTYYSPPYEGQARPTVVFSVTDTGIGIAPENKNKIFSKFEQIESIENHSVGTGLGMPICKQIIEDGHSGQIWFDSEINVGSTFCVQLPVS